MYRLCRSLGCWPKKRGGKREKERREQRKIRKERQEETRERQGRESHKKDTVESKEKHRGKGDNSTSTTRLHRHHLRHLERKHRQKERKLTETKTGVAYLFRCPEKQQPLAERRSFSTCHLRPSQRQLARKGKHNREEGKEKRRKQGEERRKRQATQENVRRTQATEDWKKGIASRPGKLSFIPSFCMHSELHLLLFKWNLIHLNSNWARHVYFFVFCVFIVL